MVSYIVMCSGRHAYTECFSYTRRSLHANGIDELLVFLGSNPEEVRAVYNSDYIV